jgi:hypothetical protein
MRTTTKISHLTFKRTLTSHAMQLVLVGQVIVGPVI